MPQGLERLILVVEVGVLVLHGGELGVGSRRGRRVVALVFGKVATLKTAKATFHYNLTPSS